MVRDLFITDRNNLAKSRLRQWPHLNHNPQLITTYQLTGGYSPTLWWNLVGSHWFYLVKCLISWADSTGSKERWSNVSYCTSLTSNGTLWNSILIAIVILSVFFLTTELNCSFYKQPVWFALNNTSQTWYGDPMGRLWLNGCYFTTNI